MKANNIKFYAVAEFSNEIKKYNFFCTEKAMSNWANKQFGIDENVTVRVFNFDDDTPYCTYNA